MRRKIIIPTVSGTLLLALALLFLLRPLENRRFSSYCDTLFREELLQNALTCHYTIADKKAYGVDLTDATLGEFSASTDPSSSEEQLKKLHEFHRSRLSFENQATYDLLDYSFRASVDGCAYALYDEPLIPVTGIQSQLPVLFAEYPFRSREDIDTYLLLLSDITRYFDSLISFEQKKLAAGLFMDAESAQELISYCNEFISDTDSHFLLETFTTRLEDVGMTTKEYEAYQRANRGIVLGKVFPAYRTLADFLRRAKNGGQNLYGLYYTPKGTDYYAWLIRSVVGSGRTFAEIEELLEQRLLEDARTIRTLVEENPALMTADHTLSLDTADTAAICEDQRLRTLADFPAIPEVTVRIDHVSPSMADYLSPAFYLTPAIDDYENNVIYLNDSGIHGNLAFYTTLAHEGYPGHLYQTVYENASSHHPVRKLLYYGGYVEGWATYAEQYSYSFCSLPPQVSTLLAASHSMTLNIYAHLDLYIHAYGWTEAETSVYLKKFGISGADTVHNVYMLIRQQPANYLKYYLGFLEICKLKEQSETALGDSFAEKEFHEFILSNGPAPFPLLQERLAVWLESRRSRIS